MIFSQAGNIVKESFLASTVAANRERKEIAAKRIDYYYHFQSEYISKQLARYVTKVDSLRPCFVNIVKKIINQLAMVYIQDATRTLSSASKSDIEIFQRIERTASLGARWKQANRLAKLCGVVMLRPVFRDGMLEIDILTPDILDITTDDTPEHIASVMITHYPDSARDSELTYSLWTPDYVRTLDYRGWCIQEAENPYQMIPFCPVWNQLPTDVFWTQGAEDLIVLQEAFNEKLTDLLYILRMQGFGVGYVKGMRGELSHVDPGTIFNLPVDGELGFAKTQAPVTDTLAVLDFILKQAAVSNGLPASSLTTDPTDESGIARIAGNRELEEVRRDDIELFRKYERNLFNIIRIVWNTHNPCQKISEKAELFIDFYDPAPRIDPEKQAALWDSLLSMGIISPVDIMLERNPDLSRDEAKARLLEIQEEKRALSESII